MDNPDHPVHHTPDRQHSSIDWYRKSSLPRAMTLYTRHLTSVSQRTLWTLLCGVSVRPTFCGFAVFLVRTFTNMAELGTSCLHSHSTSLHICLIQIKWNKLHLWYLSALIFLSTMASCAVSPLVRYFDPHKYLKGVQKWPFVLSVAPSFDEWQHEFTRVRKTNLIGRYWAGGIFTSQS